MSEYSKLSDYINNDITYKPLEDYELDNTVLLSNGNRVSCDNWKDYENYKSIGDHNYCLNIDNDINGAWCMYNNEKKYCQNNRKSYYTSVNKLIDSNTSTTLELKAINEDIDYIDAEILHQTNIKNSVIGEINNTTNDINELKNNTIPELNTKSSNLDIDIQNIKDENLSLNTKISNEEELEQQHITNINITNNEITEEQKVLDNYNNLINNLEIDIEDLKNEYEDLYNTKTDLTLSKEGSHTILESFENNTYNNKQLFILLSILLLLLILLKFKK